MESQKYISSYWDLKNLDIPRKYYKLLQKGEAELELLKEDWKLLFDILKESDE